MIEKDILEIIADIKKEEQSKPDDEKYLYHKNCGETLIETLNIKYELGIDKKAYRMLAPYGFGLCSGRTCGAFAGCVAAIGVMFAYDKPCDNKKMKEVTEKWVSTYVDTFGSIDCSYLRKRYRDPKKGCLAFMEQTAQLFEKFIEEYI